MRFAPQGPPPATPPPLPAPPSPQYADPPCRPPSQPPDVLEACFLALSALALADPELSTHLVALRASALSAAPDGDARAAKRVATAQQALATLGACIDRNRQLIATMAAAGPAAGGAAAAPAAGAPSAGGVLGLAPGGVAGSPPPAGLSPPQATPLASFFGPPGAGGTGALDASAAAAAAAGAAPGRAAFAPHGLYASPLSSPPGTGELPQLLLDPAAAHRAAAAGAPAPTPAAAPQFAAGAWPLA
jgi:hypothetical protein